MADSPTPRITISDVARQAGVSRTTVSHALNGRGQVDPATRLKVEEAARALGYRPNRHAQRLRTGGANMIALMSSMPATVSGGPSRLGFFMEVAAVAASSALERGLAMVLVPPLKSGQTPLSALDIDGALVIEPQVDDPLLAELLAQGLPVVSIGRPGGSDVDLPFVDLLSGPATQVLLTHMQAEGESAGLGAAGVDEVRWLKPVYPGDTLRCESEVIDKRASAARPDMGSAPTRMTVFNQHDEPVMRFIALALWRRRPRGDGAANPAG